MQTVCGSKFTYYCRCGIQIRIHGQMQTQNSNIRIEQVSATMLNCEAGQRKWTIYMQPFGLKLWQCVSIRTYSIKQRFIYQTAECHGIKRMYNVRIGRFIGASSAGIIQLCRQPAAFHILADDAVWFPECPGDWKILF